MQEKMTVKPEFETKIGSWKAPGHVTILCSAPERSGPGDDGKYPDGSQDNVMKALFALCDMYQAHVKFGYDWGGSVTAEPADKDPERLVPECCLSLGCACATRATAMVKGPVDWSNPKSVAGSLWFPKYVTKVQSNIMSQAQLPDAAFIEMLAIPGGPVTQLEHQTMPFIIAGAIKDLRAKGVSISLLGDAEKTKIKLFLRIEGYGQFIARFYDGVPLSVTGMCIAAATKTAAEMMFAMQPDRIAALRIEPDQDPKVKVRVCISPQEADNVQVAHDCFAARAQQKAYKMAQEGERALSDLMELWREQGEANTKGCLTWFGEPELQFGDADDADDEIHQKFQARRLAFIEARDKLVREPSAEWDGRKHGEHTKVVLKSDGRRGTSTMRMTSAGNIKVWWHN
eukprot:COSAG04_NODE_176_length_21411_cov_10.599240_26_plen_399_part_01